ASARASAAVRPKAAASTRTDRAPPTSSPTAAATTSPSPPAAAARTAATPTRAAAKTSPSESELAALAQAVLQARELRGRRNLFAAAPRAHEALFGEQGVADRDLARAHDAGDRRGRWRSRGRARRGLRSRGGDLAADRVVLAAVEPDAVAHAAP